MLVSARFAVFTGAVSLAALGVACSTTESSGGQAYSCERDDPAYAAASDTCRQLCDTKLSLDCAADGCGCYNCDWGAKLIAWCEETHLAMLRCQASQPKSAYQCVEGSATLATTLCKAESDALSSCWCAGPPGGVPDVKAKCADFCARQAGLPCTSSTCEQDCNARLTSMAPQALATRAAYAGYLQCVASHPETRMTCTGDTLVTGPCDRLSAVMFFCATGYSPPQP
jgi:hypothetical protein